MTQRIIDAASRAVDRPTLTVHVGLNRPELAVSRDRGVRALRRLVETAGACRAVVCLENLTMGWSSRPKEFTDLVREAGCRVTFDIGHAVSTGHGNVTMRTVGEYVAGHKERVRNAHVYHRETAEGHHAPMNIEDVAARLRLLLDLPLCDWWVLELRDEAALLKTLGVVRGFLETEKMRRAG
jgi:sugar phosphate isomerase/epimerase